MKWGHGGAPSSKKRGALIQKGPLDRHAQREDAVETHRVKASGRWRIGLAGFTSLGMPKRAGKPAEVRRRQGRIPRPHRSPLTPWIQTSGL